MTENDDDGSSVGKMAENSTNLIFKTSRPHFKGNKNIRGDPMNNTVLTSFAAAMNRSG